MARAATIDVTHNGATTCSVMAPFDSIACDVDGFDFQTDVITTTDDFSITTDDGVSNALSANSWIVEQISDTRPGNADNPQFPMIFNNELYFASNNASGYSKFYRTNGADIVQVSNMLFGPDDPVNLAVFNNQLYLRARKFNVSTKLFRTDGTNIIQVSDTRGGSEFSDAPANVLAFGNDLFFISNNTSAIFYF